MKTVKNVDLDSMFEELKELWRIETKMLKTTKPLSTDEIKFLTAQAEEGSPLGQFNYGYTTFYVKTTKKQLKNGGINSSIYPMVMGYGKHLEYLLLKEMNITTGL